MNPSKMLLGEQTYINTKLDLKSSQNLSVIAGILNNDERVYANIFMCGNQDEKMTRLLKDGV